MRLIEWEVAEDGYEEQIIIPKEKRELAAEEGIIDFQIINFTRPEGGRRISYTSTTDNAVKLFI